jgi:hypothetical protein
MGANMIEAARPPQLGIRFKYPVFTNIKMG